MRLIDADALKDAINDNGCRHSHYFDVFDVIDDAPTVERPKWIPITFRPMDEEEYEDFKKEFGELPIEERKMFSCPMPEDDQEILICNSWGRVSQDRCVMDECGYGLEENGDWDGIVAWMPLPKPYEKGGAET